MEPRELLMLAAATLDRLGIAYLTTGSMASTMYGEPRFTHDVDVAVMLDPGRASPLTSSFPEPDFYVSPEAAREAVATGGQFNVIHPTSGLKIDFMVARDDEFNRSRFSRARSIELAPGVFVRFASPEDVILRKLQYYKQGVSHKHIDDIRGILRVQGDALDTAYIQRWAPKLGVRDAWEFAHA